MDENGQVRVALYLEKSKLVHSSNGLCFVTTEVTEMTRYISKKFGPKFLSLVDTRG